MSGRRARAARRLAEDAREAQSAAALWSDIAERLHGDDREWAERMAAAAQTYGDLVADGPISLPALGRYASARKALDERIGELVGSLRALGASWERIGAQLGMTGEGARKRYGGAS